MHCHRHRLWPILCEQMQGRCFFQLASIKQRSLRGRGPVQMASAPNSKTVDLGPFGVVLQAPVRLSQPPAMASGPSSVELEPSVELLSVPLDASRSTGATGTVVRLVRLMPIGITSISLVTTMMPELRRPESSRLPTWPRSPDQWSYVPVLESPTRALAPLRLQYQLISGSTVSGGWPRVVHHPWTWAQTQSVHQAGTT